MLAAPSLRRIRLDRQIHGVGRVPRSFEKRLRPGDAERLMAELIAGDQEDGARRTQGPLSDCRLRLCNHHRPFLTGPGTMGLRIALVLSEM